MQHGAGAGRKGHVRACVALVLPMLAISVPILKTQGVGA
jgi:hypothetical protein